MHQDEDDVDTHLTAIFQDHPGKLVSECHHSGFSGKRKMEMVTTTEAVRITKLQSYCHHQQTNIKLSYRLDGLPVAQPTV